jgi:hypothetical protein
VTAQRTNAIGQRTSVTAPKTSAIEEKIAEIGIIDRF